MVGMHFWLRKLGLSHASCFFGALTFVFSGMFWFEIVHPPDFSAFTWLPWLMGFLEECSFCFSPLSAFFAGLSLALIFLAGNPQVFLGSFYLGTCYFFFRFFFIEDRRVLFQSGGGREWPIFQSFLFFLLGTMPILFLCLPFMDFIRFTDRILLKPNYENFTGFSIKPSELFRFFYPLRPVDPASKTLQLEMNCFTTETFLGLWTPFFVLSALTSKQRRVFKIFLFSLALFFVLISFGKYFPLHFWLFKHIPGFGLLRGPFRFTFIYQTLVCVLAALGFERLMGIQAASPSAKRILGTMGIYMALAGLGAFYWDWGEWWLLGFLAAAGIGMGLFLAHARTRPVGGWLFGSALTVSLILGGWNFCSSRLGPPANMDFLKENALFSSIQKKIGSKRFFSGDKIPFPAESGGNLFELEWPPNASCFFRLKNAGGTNALSLLARGELYTTPFHTFLRLMAIQGFATGNEKRQIPGFKRYQWGKVKFYESEEEMRPVYSPARWKVEPSPAERLKEMRRGDFMPYQESFLSETPSLGEATTLERADRLKNAVLVHEDLNSQEFDINLNAPGLVVFSEANFPGWKAWMDGTPLRIFTANHLFRGVFLHQGTHRVVFKYRPTCFALALFIFLVWAASVFAFGLNALLRPVFLGRKY